MKRKIMFWDDERSIGNSLIVTLKYGWRFSSDLTRPTHVEGFDTIKQAKDAVKAAIRCDCEECSSQ